MDYMKREVEKNNGVGRVQGGDIYQVTRCCVRRKARANEGGTDQWAHTASMNSVRLVARGERVRRGRLMAAGAGKKILAQRKAGLNIPHLLRNRQKHGCDVRGAASASTCGEEHCLWFAGAIRVRCLP